MAFSAKTVDFKKSPYTGLTRESWIEAGKYLLDGVFCHVADIHTPIDLPRRETEITYPKKHPNAEQRVLEPMQSRFEGLARTFFIAAPLIRDDPDVTVQGICLREYYKEQVLQACTEGSATFVGDYGALQAITHHTDPHRVYQQTVEMGALVVCLWVTMDAIWNAYTARERDTIAAFIASFANADTCTQNWRFFNMLGLAFLHLVGYPIRKDIMRDHAQAVLEFYVGDGWYRDGTSFDYYSCWAFNLYAPLWDLWYGYENEPYIASRFEAHSNRLMETYADFFDRDGYTNMWGRSGVYRNGATAALCANFFLRHPKADAGLSRRICSGSLLQFFSREDFLDDGIPSMGFYGAFTPMIQGYSCVHSPYWLGKAFLCLVLPETHPFWTARENNGTWEQMGEVKLTTLNGPALCFSNHRESGETILRTGKARQHRDNLNGMWSYARLCYNTKYPWEATPASDGATEKARLLDVESQQYVLTDEASGAHSRANVIRWFGEREGVLYRKQFFEYTMDVEEHWMQAIMLADIPVAYGIFRVDKLKLFRAPMRITLGAYGFPNQDAQISYRQCGNAQAIILKGHDATGCEKQLAMTVWDGWSELAYRHSVGTNADSPHSIVLYASTRRTTQYGGDEPYILISQVITKQSLADFSDAELFPVSSVSYDDPHSCGAFGAVHIAFKDGTRKRVDFEGLEGKLEV